MVYQYLCFCSGLCRNKILYRYVRMSHLTNLSLPRILEEVDRKLVVTCHAFSMLMRLNLHANYDITRFSNDYTFSNNTADHFNSETNKCDYAILMKYLSIPSQF